MHWLELQGMPMHTWHTLYLRHWLLPDDLSMRPQKINLSFMAGLA
jgi:hypothetical protein